MKIKRLVLACFLGLSLLATGCGNQEPPVINVTSVSLSDTTLTSNIGESNRLVATVLPYNATDKAVTWSTLDGKVATVSAEGIVSSVAPGSTTITVKTVDGEYTASCSITVLPDKVAKDSNGFVYLLSNDSTSYSVFYAGDRNAKSLSVPDGYYGIKVNKLLRGSFVDMEELESIKLPAQLEEIEDTVFYGNLALNSIKVGQNDLHLIQVNEVLINDGNLVIGDNNVFCNFANIRIGGHDEKGDMVVTASDTEGLVDSIDYTVKMNEVSPYKATGSLTLSTTEDKKIELGAHGIYRDVSISLKKNNETLYTIDFDSVPVYANEYNVAMLTATYPTTIFTLKAPTITNHGAIPTYVLLERPAAYDWDHLKWNIRELPNISHADATSANNSRFFGYAHDWMKDYISDLLEANPESKFHFFFTDLSVDYFYYTVVAQGIPEELYSVVLLSDGAGSADILSRTYGTWAQGNPTAKHASLMESLTKVRDYLFENGWDAQYIVNNLREKNGDSTSYTTPSYLFANHAYSTLCLFDNCEWWLNRLRATENLKAIDSEYVTVILSTKGLVQNIYANSLLAGLSEEDAANFKTIFHFNLDEFDATRQAGKKIMVILGTSWGDEANSLYNFVKATMLYFGNEYDYFYKPHPGWPTATCTDRNAVFEKLRNEGLNFVELDGAIAAEIIMYFNPDIYLSGYSSTTYASLDANNNGMGASDWTTNTEEYKDYMFTYMAVASSEERIAYSLDASKTYYVVHVNSNQDNAEIKAVYDVYDTAIICLEDNSVTYYKNSAQVNP